MTRIWKRGGHRIWLSRSPKIRAEFYHYTSRHEITIILGAAHTQAGFRLWLPVQISRAILRAEWSWAGMILSDKVREYRLQRVAWRERP